MCLRRNCMEEKKIINFNDKSNITQLSREIDAVQGLDNNLVQPLHNAISVLQEYKENHELSIQQIKIIYSKLHINEQMSPEEMDISLSTENQDIAIIEKKFLHTYIDKKSFSCMIREILRHFTNIVQGDILKAITEVIENFSYICLLSKTNFTFRDVCFKFFTKNPDSDEILVLILNICYEQTSLKYKLMDIFKLSNEKIFLNFFGALVKTDIS